MSSCIHRMLIIGRTLVVTAFVSSTLSEAIPTAQAAEVQTQVTISVRGPVAEVASAFEKRTGHTVKMTAAAPGEIVAALQVGSGGAHRGNLTAPPSGARTRAG